MPVLYRILSDSSIRAIKSVLIKSVQYLINLRINKQVLFIVIDLCKSLYRKYSFLYLIRRQPVPFRNICRFKALKREILNRVRLRQACSTYFQRSIGFAGRSEERRVGIESGGGWAVDA